MAYQNEIISEENKERFALEKMAEKHNMFPPKSWTVDKDTDSFLIQKRRAHEPGEYDILWLFYWEGHLLQINVDRKEMKTQSDGRAYRKYTIEWIKYAPDALKSDPKMLGAFKQALTAYGDFGILSRVDAAVEFNF